MGTGESMLVIWKNGNEWKRGWNASGTEVGANFFALQVNALVYADGVDDYFEIYIQQGSGGNRDITVAHQAGGWGNITWFNGTYVPTQLITSISSNSTVANSVTSTVTSDVVAGFGATVTVLDDIAEQFNNAQRIFTLEYDDVAITEGVHYTDNKDFTVSIGNRHYRAAVPQTTTLGPWIVPYTAERTYTYKVSGSRIIFYRGIESRQSAEIRINNRSATRQKKKRYPFSANSIVLGD
jgi:hypothetical protein